MMLFKAKQAAQREFDDALQKRNVTQDQLGHYGNLSIFAHPLRASRHVVACTAANAVYGLRGLKHWLFFRRNNEELEGV
jgi:hypothetical protein